MRSFQSINVRNERQFRALTGVSEQKFDQLVPVFARCLKEEERRRYRRYQAQRQRHPGGGRKGILSTPELKLFFLLFYLKNYPTFDVLGSFFNRSPSKAQENVMKFTPILKQAEKELHVLPRRHLKIIPIESQKKQDDENKRKIMIDATERPCRRPKNQRRQKNHYSGKRKAHTLKNTVIATVKGGIDVIGPTTPGHRHDYAMLKGELDPEKPELSSIEVSVDLGYQGIEKNYPKIGVIHIPHKKPRKSKTHPNPKLTPKQKRENRLISQVRVGIEHFIGQLKNFSSLTIKFRNRLNNISDQIILVVAGLCNLRNGYEVQ